MSPELQSLYTVFHREVERLVMEHALWVPTVCIVQGFEPRRRVLLKDGRSWEVALESETTPKGLQFRVTTRQLTESAKIA